MAVEEDAVIVGTTCAVRRPHPAERVPLLSSCTPLAGVWIVAGQGALRGC